MLSENELRHEMCEVAHLLYSRNYIVGMDGNLSVRLPGNLLLCTPSGICKGDLTPERILKTDIAGRKISGDGSPSSELAMHLIAYKERSDVRAVVHAHPLTAVALSVAGKSLDAVLLPEVAYYLGGIVTAPYATPGTQDLAAALAPLFGRYDAVVMARHGVVTVGQSLKEAYYKVEYVEYAAQVVSLASQCGTATPLEPQEVAKLLQIRQQRQVFHNLADQQP